MRIYKSVLFIGFSVFLAGCSIHPLPEQFARDTTSDIVHKVNCEGREALDKLMLSFLRLYNEHPEVVRFV